MFAAVTGITTATATESDVQTLSPSVATTAQNLAVRVTAAPGVGNSITVTLRVDGADTALTCTISGAATTCNSAAATASIPAASQLSFELTPSGLGLPTVAALVGWETG
jgi:hypothetical protein